MASAALGQTTHRVPDDFPAIQQAVADATNGDVVLVAPGTYLENLDFLGKSISVQSESGPADTIIDGQQAGSVVTFATHEGRGSVLRGFTLRNGLGSQSDSDQTVRAGGGIRISGSSPTIEGNVITGNSAGTGGGISVFQGLPLIRSNSISRNLSQSAGGGISFDGARTTEVRENSIAENVARSGPGGGIWVHDSFTLSAVNNVIRDNASGAEGGGIDVEGSAVEAHILQNVITGNAAPRGGGVSLRSSGGASLIVNNTIADNDSKSGSGLFLEGGQAAARVVNNIVIARGKQTGVFCEPGLSVPALRSNAVTSPAGARYGGGCSDKTGVDGNVAVLPLFSDTVAGNYHLRARSPGIDAGDNGAPFPATDLDGDPRVSGGSGDAAAVVDLGADEFQPGGPAAIALEPQSASVPFASDHCVAALVTDEFDLPLRGISIDFAVSGANDTRGTDTTDDDGQATFCYSSGELSGDDAITATPRSGARPSAAAAARIEPPESTSDCRVSYSGKILVGTPRQATIGGSAAVRREKTRGKQRYKEAARRTAVRERLVLSSVTTEALTCDFGSIALFGRARTRDLDTREKITVGYRVDLVHDDETPAEDQYRLRLTNGYDSGVQALAKGKIRIQIPE